MRGAAPWRAACVAAVALVVAAPGMGPGAIGGLLALIGWGAHYVVATATRRPLVWCYLLGTVYVIGFSWSLRFITGLPALGAIGAVGGLYHVLAALWCRGLRRRFGATGAWVGFACGIAAAHWLRAHAPEIPYPHGQPAHAFWCFPAWLGPVAWGGEAFGNAVVAAAAAAAVELARAWARAPHGHAGAMRSALGIAGVWVACAVVPRPGAAPRDASAPAELDVVIVQPGLTLEELLGSTSQTFERYAVDRLLLPSRAVAGPNAPAPHPDLVVWPESCLRPYALVDDPPRWARRGGVGPRFDPGLAAGVRLLAGGLLYQERRPRGEPGSAWRRQYAIAALVDARGRLIDWHEKRHPVPAAERMPFLDWVPSAWRDAYLDWGRGIVGYTPEAQPGRSRPPLETAAGVPFAALVCFDNAFDSDGRAAVAGGARLLLVLSNEAWFRRGAELEQLVAASVCRALETATPVIRCAVDGLSGWVDADGRIRTIVAPGAGPGGTARVARFSVPLGAGALPPLLWLHDAVLVLLALSGVVAVFARARILG